MEFKCDTNPSKANMEGLVAAVELVQPRFKGRLLWSRACLAGWAVTHKARHTVPLCRGPAHLMAAHLASFGVYKAAVGLLIQQALGLRPSELLDLRASDATLPEDTVGSVGMPRATLGLGLRTGTKAKRAQAVVLRDPRLIGLLRFLVAEAKVSADDRLVGLSYEQYRRLISRAEAATGISVGWTPHSARAGFATDAKLEGLSFTEIREAGRWVADASLRTYLDVVASANISVSLKISGLNDAIAYAVKNFLEYLPSAHQYQWASDRLSKGFESVSSTSVVSQHLGPSAALGVHHAAEGLPQDRRRLLRPGERLAAGAGPEEASDCGDPDWLDDTGRAAVDYHRGGGCFVADAVEGQPRGRAGRGSGRRSAAATRGRARGRGAR